MDAPGCVLSGILSASWTEWVAVYIFTSGAIITLLPIMILLLSRNVQFLSLLSLTLCLSQLLRQGNASKNRQLQIDMPSSIRKVTQNSWEHEQTKCITRTTFFKNMYVFSQKDYPVFLMLIFNALCISFSCELIVRNFTWDPCIPYIPAWLKWIVK